MYEVLRVFYSSFFHVEEELFVFFTFRLFILIASYPHALTHTRYIFFFSTFFLFASQDSGAFVIVFFLHFVFFSQHSTCLVWFGDRGQTCDEQLL